LEDHGISGSSTHANDTARDEGRRRSNVYSAWRLNRTDLQLRAYRETTSLCTSRSEGPWARSMASSSATNAHLVARKPSSATSDVRTNLHGVGISMARGSNLGAACLRPSPDSTSTVPALCPCSRLTASTSSSGEGLWTTHTGAAQC